MALVKYTCGFAYHERRVLLCCKSQPDWMNGLWSGVGGKCKSDEVPVETQRREFLEETGTFVEQWELFCNEFGPGYVVHFFRATLSDGHSWPLYNDRGEPLSWAYLNDLTRLPCVGNVQWLVPLGYDWRTFSTPVTVSTGDSIRGRPTW